MPEENQSINTQDNSESVNDETNKSDVETSETEATQTQTESASNDDDLLKKARKEARYLKETIAKQKADLEKFAGVNLEEYQQLVELKATREREQQEQQRKELENKQEYDKAIALEREDHTKKQNALLQENQALKQEIINLKADIANENILREFQIAFVDAGGIPTSTKFLYQDLRGYFQYDPESRVIKIVNPQTGVEEIDKKGNAIALREFIESFKNKTEYLNLFKSTNNANGSGAPPSSNGKIKGTIDLSNLSASEMRRQGRNQSK